MRTSTILAILLCAAVAPAMARSSAPSCQAAPAATAPSPSPAGPATPPIDCPLHGKNVADLHLRPFEDVEKYIAFLERPDRDEWQRPDAVVQALGLSGHEVVVDVGAGSGYFTFRIARVLPMGRVVAEDIEPEMVRHIHHRVLTGKIPNVTAVLGDPDDPRIPPDADVVFVCDVLHHVAHAPAWLAKLAAEMTPKKSRLVLIEFKEGPLPQGPPENAKLTRAQMLELARAAGLRLVADKPDLLPYQTFMVFERS